MEITPASTLAVLDNEKDYLKALVMAFRLNEAGLIRRVFQAVPPADVGLVVADMPTVYVPRLLRFVAAQTEESPHIEFCLLWIRALVDKHGGWLSANRARIDVELRVVSRAVARMRDEIRRLADENVYMVDYLLGQAEKNSGRKSSGARDVVDGDSGEMAGKMLMEMNGDAVSDASDDDEWLGLE
jgi:periodic tryptophan protein 2